MRMLKLNVERLEFGLTNAPQGACSAETFLQQARGRRGRAVASVLQEERLCVFGRGRQCRSSPKYVKASDLTATLGAPQLRPALAGGSLCALRLQLIGSHTLGVSPSLQIFCDGPRVLVNSGENVQRQALLRLRDLTLAAGPETVGFERVFLQSSLDAEVAP